MFKLTHILGCLGLLFLLLLAACGTSSQSTSTQQQTTSSSTQDDAQAAHDAAQTWCNYIAKGDYDSALQAETSQAQFTTENSSRLKNWEATTFYGIAANDGSKELPPVTGCSVSPALVKSGTYAGQDYNNAQVHITWTFNGQPSVEQDITLDKEGDIWKVNLSVAANSGF